MVSKPKISHSEWYPWKLCCNYILENLIPKGKLIATTSLNLVAKCCGKFFEKFFLGTRIDRYSWRKNLGKGNVGNIYWNHIISLVKIVPWKRVKIDLKTKLFNSIFQIARSFAFIKHYGWQWIIKVDFWFVLFFLLQGCLWMGHGC